MSKVEIMNKVTRGFHKVGFVFKKHSPEILVAAGIVGAVGAGVLACKATLKVHEVTDKAKHDLDLIHEAGEKGVTQAGEVYTEEDVKKETAVVYVQTGVGLAKLYGPAIGLGVLSITAILAGHNITRKRNLALAAAYTAVDKSFKQYRGRVIERFGEALDKELKYGIQAKEVEEVIVNEDGSEVVEKKMIDVVDNTLGSEYAVFFDDGCIGWTKNPEFNKKFLLDQQRYANDLLKTRGHVFLNEVYDMIGIPRTQAGQVVGWIYDNPNGDGFIDFGIFDIHREANRNFVNGYERTIMLDFNVDGNIWEMM